MGAEGSITSGNFLSRMGPLSKTPVQVFRVRASRLHWPGVHCNSTLASALGLGRKQTSVTALPLSSCSRAVPIAPSRVFR